ncbi:hypothetical protein MKW94_007057 [Papaver nudicaule]|uniref:Uncharacterized protein n=1 Tax=Papaver nudicaule TaxID=74823 RepID=A0AA41V5T1_PAPNU|nr:hypothetical protein [Papaver nudicaule]
MATISLELYPSQDDLLYEEEILRNPFSLKLWWRYLNARSESPFNKRSVLYERALKALPGSYKLWYAYLRERLKVVRNLPVTHSQYESLNNTFERALVTMHKMPEIWAMYLQTLMEQKHVTRTRKAFDRALGALPVTQHGRIWELYLCFVGQTGIPVETSLRVHRRYLKFDPTHVEDFIDFLVSSELWQEAAERFAGVLNDDEFCSIKCKTKHQLWVELCDLLVRHATEVSGLNVEALIRGGIEKFKDETGRLWTSLADYYIRRGLFDKARDVFEEGMATVVTVRDFSMIFDGYTRFEESVLAANMESCDISDEENDNDQARGDEDHRYDTNVSLLKFTNKTLHGFWSNNDNDVNLRLARLEHLTDRRPELLNSVLLRQNPHNVAEWHKRVELFEGNPAKQILAYAEAVRNVDPLKAVGKPHSLWVSFAQLYIEHNDIANARVIFDKAVQVNYKTVDNLASVWCAWIEMELLQNNFEGARELMRRATAEPSVEVQRRVAAAGNEPVQMKLHKSLRLWSLNVDIEECLGNLESTRAVYERILESKIATPQIILNYARLLEQHKYFEDAFQIYERGVKIFKYPHAKDIWVTYLTKFVRRNGKKLERARELFEHAIEMTPADYLKPLYLQYAKLEEVHGSAKRAMEVYNQAAKALPDEEKLEMYEIYIAHVAKFYPVPDKVKITRKIYEQAVESGLPSEDVKTMCMKYAEFEKSLDETDRARAIYIFSSQFADPQSDDDFWSRWNKFEVQYGNEDTFREMLRIKRSVSACHSQTHFILPEVESRPGVIHTPAGGRKVIADQDYMELPEGDDDEDGNKEAGIRQRDVPAAVFGDLAHKAGEKGEDGDARKRKSDSKPGALERMKRSRH